MSVHDGATTCSKCGKKFTYRNYGDVWPGGKDREYIYCPYCNEINGSIITSGQVISSKLDE